MFIWLSLDISTIWKQKSNVAYLYLFRIIFINKTGHSNFMMFLVQLDFSYST